MNYPPVLTLFNNKGGVGKTSLIYHLAWMYSQMGKKVLCVDLDPQANLTSAFLSDDELENLFDSGSTVYTALNPLAETGDIMKPCLKKISERLFLLPGDPSLSDFEETLSDAWPKALGETNLYRPMRILSSFWQQIMMASEDVSADLVLLDVGPNLGAINRSALIATDYIVIPLGADLFSLQGLKNLGPVLKKWRSAWKKRFDNWRDSKEASAKPDFMLPQGNMKIIGYLCQQYGVRFDRPVNAYEKWIARIPALYRQYVDNSSAATTGVTTQNDPYCLFSVKHFRSLIPMGQECRKPIFKLTSSDGAIGSHAVSVKDAERDFNKLASIILDKISIV